MKSLSHFVFPNWNLVLVFLGNNGMWAGSVCSEGGALWGPHQLQ